MTWKTVTLGEVLTESAILSDAPSTDRRITVRLNVKGVEKRPVGNDKEGATKYFVRQAGQFIYGRQNLHKGAFGLVPPDLDGYESSQDLPAFDVAEQCEPAWLIYFLRQGNFYESLDRLARGIGSRRINPKDLYLVEMPLPPLDEQRALLQTLAATDEAAETLGKDFAHQATLLTRLRQAVLREAVQGRLVPQHATDEPAPALLARIRAEKQRLVKAKQLRADKPLPPLSETEVPYEVPEGWAWCRLGDVCNQLLSGFAFESEKYVPHSSNQVIRLGNVKNDLLVLDTAPTYIDDEYASKTHSVLLKPEDILITMTGTKAKQDYLFSVTLDKKDFASKKLYLNQRVGCLRIHSSVSVEYAQFVLKEESLLKPVFESATGSANQANASVGAIKNITVPLPPLPEQRRIMAKVTELLAHCTALEAELGQARQAAGALHAAALREAFRGAPVAVA